MSLKLSALFCDHAVLQRGIPVPVWGWASPGSIVSISLGVVSAATRCGVDGRFRVDLPSMPAGGPFELRVSAGGHEVVVRDVFVGEVWLASGQSNMEFTLAACGKMTDIAEADHPLVRMITVDHTALIGPRSNFEGVWQTATPQNAQAFSAVGYFFARRICAELGVAVGIINSSWGGTIAQAWTSREALAGNPDDAAWMRRYHAKINTREYWDALAAPKVSPYPADPGNQGVGKGWAKPEFSDQAWPTMELPSVWQSAGHNYSGVFWFRKTVEIPAEWAGQDLMLNLGAVDKQDITWFNGEQVGATGKGMEEMFWNAPRNYRVPGRLVRPGRNVIAVRAYSFIYAGGLLGPAFLMTIHPDADKNATHPVAGGSAIPLAGAWSYQVEHDFGLVVSPMSTLGEGNPNSPHMLFDNMIAPLVPYGLRGAIWYQGESNADGTSRYHRLITEMIRGWRYAWGQGNFPFLQVQLANYQPASPFQPTSTWALLRETQLQAVREADVGMAVAIDIGDAEDIHPTNKRDVGHRLAQWALGRTYGRAHVPSGPLYSHMTIEGDRIRIHFEHAAGGLVAKGGSLKTFFVADVNRRFVEAEAQIEGSTVVVGCKTIAEPLAVRYAWADNPVGCNLCNAEGLPASPFRTDTWPMAGTSVATATKQ